MKSYANIAKIVGVSDIVMVATQGKGKTIATVVANLIAHLLRSRLVSLIVGMR